MTPSAAPSLLSILVSFCMARHWPAEALFRSAGHDLTSLRLGASTLSPEQYLQVLALAAQRFDCPTVALALGQFIHSEQLGVFGTLLASCAHLQQAVERFNQFRPLLDEHIQLVLDRQPEGLWVRCRLPEPDHPLRAELLLSALLSQGRQFCGQSIQPLRVQFRQPRPAHAAACNALFGVEVEFAQPQDGLLWPEALLTLPFLTASQRLHEQVVHAARSLTPPVDDRLPPRVARHLRQHLHEPARCQLPDVARAFGRSPRSLQRHLQAEQCSLQQLLDQVRQQHCCALLTQTLLPVEQIAWQVGFAHPSSLNEKFLRWTGLTPSQYRQQHRATLHPGC